jgi:hypothetical protein
LNAYKIRCLGKCSFSYTHQWLVLFETSNGSKSIKWVALLSDVTDDNSKVKITDIIPIENEIIKDVTFFYEGYIGLFVHYKSDSTDNFQRYYGLDRGGFEKLFDVKGMNELERANKIIKMQ